MQSFSKVFLIVVVVSLILLFFITPSTDAVNVNPNYNATCSDTNKLNCGENFVCRGSYCGECIDSSECHGFYSPAYECVLKPFPVYNEEGIIVTRNLKSCQRKDLFPSIMIWDVLSIILCFFGGALAASSGIGGGAIYVGFLTLVARYPSTMAVPISTACIFGTALSNVFILVLQKHPTKNRPLIDYSTALLTEPIILAGTIIGVFLNVMLPDWLTLILLLILLTLTSYRSITKGIKTFKKESIEKAKARALANTEIDDKEVKFVASEDKLDAIDEYDIAYNRSDSSPSNAPYSSPYQDHLETHSDDENEGNFELETPMPDNSKALKRMLWFESWRIPPVKLVILAFAWAVVFTASLLKGTKGNPSLIGINSCKEPLYWVVILVAFPILLLISLGTGLYLRIKHSKKVRLNYVFAEGDIKWTTPRSFLLPFLFLSAGIVAGLLGIGGGIVVGPLFLELGMHARVSMATSSFMILFTSSSTMIQYVFMNAIKPYFAIAYIFAGLISGGMGQLVIGYFVKKFNRASIVIFVIAISIAIAAVLQSAVGIFNIVNQIREGILSFSNLGFKPPC